MTSTPPPVDAQDYLENLMRAGQDAMKQFDDARSYFQRSITAADETGQKYAESHEHLGMLLAGEGDSAGAIAQFREALQIDPNLPGAQRGLAAAMKDRDRR